jgi:hypothetical protein
MIRKSQASRRVPGIHEDALLKRTLAGALDQIIRQS